MFLPVAPLLHMTNLIQEGSVEIHIGKNVVHFEKDLIRVNIYDTESLMIFLDREDIFPQIRHLSKELSRAGKTLEIAHRGSRIVRLGAHADSVVLRLLGLNHIAVGNPVTLYRFLHAWGKG